jgi:FixJ family two-component response regulator
MTKSLAYRDDDFTPSSARNTPAHDRGFAAGQVEEEPIVYLVDDDAVTRMALESLLASEGSRVEAFSSGKAFLERVRPESPACIVMDIRMPDATGLEIQEELARRDIHTPIIFLTGYAVLVVRGRLNKQIAHEMDITEKTVKAHRGKAMKKMKASSVAELVLIADSLSLTEPDQSAFAR